MKLIKLSPKQIQSHNKIGNLITTDKNFNIELINYYLGINYNHYENDLICNYIKNNIHQLISNTHISYKVFDILHIEKLTIFTNIEIRNNISHIDIQGKNNYNSKYVFLYTDKGKCHIKKQTDREKTYVFGNISIHLYKYLSHGTKSNDVYMFV